MINITDKSKCVGCKACGQICPKQCISFFNDDQGFEYPQVNMELCINCGLCEKTCPVIQTTYDVTPISVKLFQSNSEEILYKSSSGGAFSMLASMVLRSGGVVFGAIYDRKWNVIHGFIEELYELNKIQGSKYVQSDIRNSFVDVRRFLKEGRTVLFSGTPCQIKALNLFLARKWDEQLITIDVACHGVPSPKVWNWFLLDRLSIARIKSIDDITSVFFRDKRNGWLNYGTSICAKSHDANVSKEIFFGAYKNNIYMQSYLNNLNIRPSCFACPAKSARSMSDLTLADSWGIQYFEKKIDYSKGVSTIIVRTAKGLDLLNRSRIKFIPIEYETVLKYNPSLSQNTIKPNNYDDFWREFNSQNYRNVFRILNKLRPSLYSRIKFRLHSLIR